MRKSVPVAGLCLLVLAAGVLLGWLSRAPAEARPNSSTASVGPPDVTATASLKDTTRMFSLPVQGFQGASCVLNGTWKANVDFWISCDGGRTWQRAMVYWEQLAGRIVDSAGAGDNGTYRWVDLGGATHVGVQLGTYASGTVQVLLRTTAAQANTSMTVARDGVMGPQVPIMHIVGGTDAGGQIAHAVRVTNGPVDTSTYGLNVRLVPYSYRHINRNATTTVESGAGILHAVTINGAGAGWTITVYDNTSGSGTVLATIRPVAGSTLIYDLRFRTGCTLVTSGARAGDITVTYQ
ncbi:MAG TPA: hypothetical protein VG013_35175 [Gemmataceae bacterium]|jgi:hypothetical protein|nr:hypothetical protein [Gemmataceae bacterium]